MLSPLVPNESMASLPSSSTAFTHLLALIAGVAIGKSIDADELDAYRAGTDDFWAKIRRRIKSVLVGGVVLTLIYKTGSMTMRGIMGDGDSSNRGGDSATERRAQ